TDVETECNGLMTYDREITKVDVERVRAANTGKIPVLERTAVVPAAEQKAVEWKYTLEKPAERWMANAFDDSSWKTGAAGFGTEGTPGAVVRTKWDSADIWMRRTFELGENVPVE